MHADYITISKKLNTKNIGKTLHVFESVSSTNDVIKDLPHENGLTVIAKSQTNGRGRLGRSWSSDGGVYFSFMLTPPFTVEDAPFITIMAAVAVCNAINKQVPCRIKWPNDIIINGKKVCGILTQSASSGGETEYIIVGIGINTNTPSFPDEIKNTATSMMAECQSEINENDLLCDILEIFEEIYYNTDKDKILSMFKDKCATLGRKVTVHFQNGQADIKGLCTDILPDASLMIKTDSGDDITVSSGEVSVRGIYGYAN